MARLYRKLLKSKHDKKITGGLFDTPSEQKLFGSSKHWNDHNANSCFLIVKESGNSYVIGKDQFEKKTDQGHNGERGETELTLKDLKKARPPGFRKFETSLGSVKLDEELALQLWEDIFKPLYTFDFLKIDSGHLEM